METRDRMAPAAAHSQAGTGVAVLSSAYVDWAAILGGATIAVALAILATGFGAALGLTAVSAEEGAASSGTVGLILSTVWMVLSMIGVYAVGGYVAGRMRRRPEGISSEEGTVRDGVNGLIVWAVGTVVGVVVLGTVVSSTVGTVGSVAATGAEVAGAAAGSAVGGLATAAAEAVPADATADAMEFATGSLLRPVTVAPGTETSEATTSDAGLILSNVVATGELSDSDRAYLVQLTAARTGLSPSEVEARVDQAVAAAQRAREEAAQLAEEAEQAVRDAAETARISAILTAFLLTATSLVAAVAAYGAAVRGGRDRDEGRFFAGTMQYR
jgi:uncharacterized tellurite resistance protein B-like protein